MSELVSLAVLRPLRPVHAMNCRLTLRYRYKNHRVDGKVTAVWPGSVLGYMEMISEIRPEDFEIKYRTKNRFRFMGNGRTKMEYDPKAVCLPTKPMPVSRNGGRGFSLTCGRLGSGLLLEMLESKIMRHTTVVYVLSKHM